MILFYNSNPTLLTINKQQISSLLNQKVCK